MGEVIVRTRSGLTTDVVMGAHSLVGDEPVEGGGADLGPSPYELLLAALGTCTAITVRMYAARQKWPLEGVEVRLRHERMDAEDCAHCDTQEGFLDRISKELALFGPLDDAQRARLGEIAKRCPVQRTLQREVVIEQTLR